MSTRIIIPAAGKAGRWNDHLGVRKHFIPINGEPLLNRMVRQLTERGMNDIIVVGPPIIEEYNIAGSHLYIPKELRKWGDASKFMNSAHLWNPGGRTIILYGDVCFTEKAMDTIVHHEERDWTLFARWARGGECWAMSFYGEGMIESYQGLVRIYDLWTEGILRRNGGWEWWLAMIGMPDTMMHKRVNENSGRSVVIDDLTEDFDYPGDYDNWIEGWNKQ